MTEDLSRSPPTNSNSRSGRSFVSRLTSPFASKTRPFVDFAIEPDDLHRTYFPGDPVTGSIRLKVLKAFRVTHITLCLHGFVQVFRHANRTGDVNRFPHTGRGRQSGEYFGNGYASLFDDEVVLCGEGRLDEGIYQFNFEMDFPKKSLPSSIDFERGTISYMLTASLTRPTTIAPVAFCDRKLKFLETIDIAPLSVPRPREVSIKAVSKRSRVKQISRRHTTDQVNHVEGQSLDSAGNNPMCDGQDANPAPRSPCPSEISFDSFASSGGRNSHAESGPRSSKTSDSGRTNNNASSNDVKIIRATIELLKSGGLQGDHVPLRITVNHIKHVKSLHGVIVTMYRQARVDTHPALPLGPMKEGEKEKYEDYYPKSLTGLGGLSLSTAGSSQNFRKDLSQSFTPLIIDPTTLTADVKATVRIPDDTFPTISCVPGSMISFKYYIEVVLDLQGKLAGQDRFLPSIGLLNQPTNLQGATGAGQGNRDSLPAAWTDDIVDTEPIRRDKSVVSCTFEITVGTKDSERRKGKYKIEATLNPALQEPAGFHDVLHDFAPPGDSQEPYDGEQWAANYYGEDRGYVQHQDFFWDHYRYQQSHDNQQGYDNPHYQPYDPTPQQQQFPIPSLAEQEAQLPEKERLWRAEERLLPSQPPGPCGEEPGANQSSTDAPSAPPLSNEFLRWSPENRMGIGGFQNQTQSGTETRVDDPASIEPVPRYSSLMSASDMASIAGYPSQPQESSGAHLPPTDDKQELQRRRLQMEASSPDDIPEPEVSSAATVLRMPLDDHPTAPVIEDGAEDGVGSSERLPRYER